MECTPDRPMDLTGIIWLQFNLVYPFRRFASNPAVLLAPASTSYRKSGTALCQHRTAEVSSVEERWRRRFRSHPTLERLRQHKRLLM